MGQGYYYTLSAIAQSFAAIIALSAVFVVYKLQVLKGERGELVKRLRNVKLREMIKHGGFTKETGAMS